MENYLSINKKKWLSGISIGVCLKLILRCNFLLHLKNPSVTLR